jgi:hypothetical protein
MNSRIKQPIKSSEDKHRGKPRLSGTARLVLIAVAVVGLLLWTLDVLGWNPVAAMWNGTVRTLGTLSVFGVAFLVFVVWAHLATISWFNAREDKRQARHIISRAQSDDAAPSPTRRRGLVAAGLWILSVVFLACLIFSWVVRGHNIRHQAVNQVLTVKQDRSPEYLPRPPFGQSESLLKRDLGEVPGRALDYVWRFSVDEGEGSVTKTCGLLTYTRNSFWRPAAGVACRTDAGRVEVINFEGSVPTPGAGFVNRHRLADEVNDLIHGAITVDNDVYAYIQDGKPFMVSPVRKITGFPDWRHAWAATIVWDTDGRPTVHRSLDGSIPGPAVGVSNADDVLRAVNNRGSWRQSFLAETSYDTASEGANVRHYLLERSDGSGEHLVTMLTPRGSSETTVAILEVSLDEIGTGGWPAATLYQLPSASETGRARASNAEVIATIRNLYGPALQLADSGNQLLELTPLDGDVVNVTVGTNLVTLARVEFNQVTRESCIFTTTGRQVRCYAADTAQLSRTALPELFTDDRRSSDPDANPSDGVGATDRPLSELSNAELADLLRQVADELNRREAVLD